ncbi:hypothetical protein LCGC14_2164540 [marine sediment metagenome]|uniref:Uncharacterized protein n=1 Tax=marine sediment metagenome TaxID=412755 RepID=A0A0F9DRQ5_9ZZZZ
MKFGFGVMCEYPDDAPEAEGTVLFDGMPKVGDEVTLPSNGKVWIIVRINNYGSYPIIVKRKDEIT